MRRMTWSILLAVALLTGAIALTLDTSPLLLAQGDPTETPTATPTVCPMATPEPLWVDPVISPTDLLTQTIRVAIGNGDAVTVTTQTGVYTTTGTFGVMNPALVTIDLAPNVTNALTVTAHVGQVAGPGGCPYGGYTISTITDRNGGPLIIVQQSATTTPTPTLTATPTPTATPTVTATPTATATPEYKQYLPYLARRAPGAPGAPELAIGLVLGGAMTLSWTAAPNATGYIALQAATPDMANPVVLYRGAALSFTQMPPRGLHYFAVYAVNAVGLTLSNVVPLDYNPPPPGIGGRVTDKGAPAANVLLRLRHFDGVNWATAAETRTAADGTYLFANAAGLGAEQLYYVLYPNAEVSDTRLSGYGTARLYSYATGTRENMSPFDITNIPLRSPLSGIPVSLPATFAWDRRGVAGDSYAWQLLDPMTGRGVYLGPQVGENEAYTLTAQPSEVALGVDYGWWVRVYGLPRDEANFGVARFYRIVTFSASAKGDAIDATEARPSQGIERIFESVP